jgi:hypothetical protein
MSFSLHKTSRSPVSIFASTYKSTTHFDFEMTAVAILQSESPNGSTQFFADKRMLCIFLPETYEATHRHNGEPRHI